MVSRRNYPPPSQRFPFGATVEDERTMQTATVIVPDEKALAEMPPEKSSVRVRWHRTNREAWTDGARLRPVR